ncbi:PhzF family phenazine biosynthesis protein [Dysgonomonas hofstadii]|uniref:PhzF family phenazine biosynthesis protein n=1 Tax=Dysgonomonas hofstadii TaxID=637886 RepID=A0A840CS95_9BACT|nr:PhzF family phenazine biosynthesis protein [Dysgonomonas hofstadii]MBB4034613.1 PhzF family phenazine biosynthesis protein [Dysgonomonas hofstadii]
MRQKIYQVDAFAQQLFTGNPAAVCPLDSWLPDELMQKIAMENNLAETAFYVKEKDGSFQIRWFTPAAEVDLCGHATLATAYVLFNYEGVSEDIVHLYSPRSGKLTVAKGGDYLTLNFPSDVFSEVELTEELTAGLNIKPDAAYRGKTDYMLVYKNEDEILNIVPDFNLISKIEARGIIVTAKGDNADFVSRFFAPQVNVNEDPVTGSAHTTLTPFWSERLNKEELSAIQLSSRKGYLSCKYLGERVEISGQCKLYLTGEIYI